MRIALTILFGGVLYAGGLLMTEGWSHSDTFFTAWLLCAATGLTAEMLRD